MHLTLNTINVLIHYHILFMFRILSLSKLLSFLETSQDKQFQPEKLELVA